MSNKILFVDDDFNILNLLDNYLSMKGFEVQTAENGYFALKKIDSFQPDVIILDIMMPRMDGYEVCEKIREHHNEELARTPIIVISALNHLNDVKKAISAGANDYIVKPINLQVLFEKIKRYMNVDDLMRTQSLEDNLLTLEKLDKGMVLSIQGKIDKRNYDLLEKHINGLPQTEFIILFFQNIEKIEDTPTFVLEDYIELFATLSIKNKCIAVEQKELFSLMEDACLRKRMQIYRTLMEAYEEVRKNK